ncbi:L-fuconolactonase [Pseudomonas duriflava]|uniref:L-fuconolactonase n=1 Tax=Pseudomonas duriflava TaxID=459528 RepID=A0A562QPE3_9PSED|nr:amidohydrolase family protein [Pseudomonas duriflava]TWI58631.1 L-fuconolactonase [Pseudomonas duriflava]
MTCPEIPRIDAHQHFWRYVPDHYRWIDDSMLVLKRDYLPNDLKPLLKAHQISGCIAVQARQSEQETNALLALAKEHPWIAGVIGWVDVRDASLPDALDRWQDVQRLRGFRHQIQDEANPNEFLADTAFNQGVAILQTRGYLYEILIKSSSLAATYDFARRHDRQPLILDHLGKPPVTHGNFQTWAEQLAPLAALPHVHCKLSGLITEAEWATWQPDQLLPYLNQALELFGPERLLFGSDWPVCRLAGEYDQVYQLTQQALASLSASERAAIMGGNAIRLYGLTEQAQEYAA